MAFDLVVRGGQVVTPRGVGRWDIGIRDGILAVVDAPGTVPTEGAQVVDAAGRIVVPGGIEPHTHLAQPLVSQVERPLASLGPEDDTLGMAFGGTTTHIDFCYVRPGMDLVEAVEQRAARWKGNAHVDYAFHVALCGALPIRAFEQLHEVMEQGYPSVKVFTTDVLPPRPGRSGTRLDFGRIQLAMEVVRRQGGILTVHAEDDDIVQFNYERFRAEGRMDGANLHLVHNKTSEAVAFRRVIALARAMETAVYFVHTSAREGVEAVQEARAAGLPVYAETLHQYACFDAEQYKTPRGFCYHTYPSLKLPEDQAALWGGLVSEGISCLATDEVPTSLAIKLRGRTIEDVTGGNVGAEARMGIAYSEGVVKRGMTLERFAAVTSTNAARLFGLYPRKGEIAPGSDADLAIIDPGVQRALTREDFHVSDYSPWEGWPVSGWPTTTIARGRVLVDGGRRVGELGGGQLISRKIDPAVLRRAAC